MWFTSLKALIYNLLLSDMEHIMIVFSQCFPPPNRKERLLRCSQCKVARYCDVRCQVMIIFTFLQPDNADILTFSLYIYYATTLTFLNICEMSCQCWQKLYHFFKKILTVHIDFQIGREYEIHPLNSIDSLYAYSDTTT